MINCTEVRPGQYFTWENELYQCIERTLNKTAMAKMKVSIKVKQPKTGVVKELSLIGGDQLAEADVERKNMQFLYDAGDSAVFMDSDSYEQLEIPMERLKWEKNFLVANLDVEVRLFEGDVIGIELPDKVDLQITDCEQAVKGDTARSALKNATCETGLLVKVPLFIEQGETITVSTTDGKYAGRA